MNRNDFIMEVVAYGGSIRNLTAEQFIEKLQAERPNEISGNSLTGLSVAYFEARRLNVAETDLHNGITGIKQNEISFVNAQTLIDIGAKIKKNPQTGFPYHALLSGVDARSVFEMFRSSGVYIGDKTEWGL